MPPIWRRLEGKSGRIEIEELASTVGQLAGWTLTRRDGENDSGYYDLHATLAFIQRGVFSDGEYAKRVIVTIGGKNGRPHLLQPTPPGDRTVLSGRSLIMERVELIDLTKGRNGSDGHGNDSATQD